MRVLFGHVVYFFHLFLSLQNSEIYYEKRNILFNSFIYVKFRSSNILSSPAYGVFI